MATTHWPVYSPMAKEHFGKAKARAKLEQARMSIFVVRRVRGLW